jgi:membrane-bound lytic murein transglycosylase D
LLVPRRGTAVADVSSSVADNAMMVLASDAPPMKKVALRAGKHDSVETIAKRYRVSASQVAQWNDVGTGAKFAAGQTVVVYVAGKGRKGATSTSTRIATTTHGTRVAHSTHRKAGPATASTGTKKHVSVANN